MIDIKVWAPTDKDFPVQELYVEKYIVVYPCNRCSLGGGGMWGNCEFEDSLDNLGKPCLQLKNCTRSLAYPHAEHSLFSFASLNTPVSRNGFNPLMIHKIN